MYYKIKNKIEGGQNRNLDIKSKNYFGHYKSFLTSKVVKIILAATRVK